MKQLKNMQIIGIDHGYGNLKTASGIFPASVLTFDHDPAYAQDLLIYDGKSVKSLRVMQQRSCAGCVNTNTIRRPCACGSWAAVDAYCATSASLTVTA